MSRRRSKTPQRTAFIDLALYHGQPVAILLVSTLVLFRTWIGGRYPGGTDSAFLYSGMAFYRTHGLQLFTVWLPTPFGQISQYSLYWFLSMLMTVFRSALFTYKLAAVSIALISAFGMYAISWSWSRSRLGALAAAIFYSFSPLSIAQWSAGHLDVQTSMALGPLVIWSIDRVLDTGSRRAALGLGLCGSALLLLTTGQAAYWVPVVAIFVMGKCLIAPRGIAAMLWRAVPGTLLAVAVFAVASAVQLLPWLFGAHAAFAGGQNFAIEALSVHAKYSVPFGQGIIGIPREVWLLPGSNLSVASFSSPLFIVPQVGIAIFASLSVLTRKGVFCIVFLLLAVGAWFLAAGPFGPGGSFYAFLWQHIAYFRLLRVPNRWLMVSSFSVASMLAQSIAAVTSRRFSPTSETGRVLDRATFDLKARMARWASTVRRNPRCGAARAVLLVVVAGSLLALNGEAILARGLPTFTPPLAYVEAYSALARTTGDWRVLTVPFEQAWMAGPGYGDYEDIAADLGYASTFYDGRSTLENGGWDLQASQFVNFIDAIVKQGDNRHLAGLLGAADIRYVVLNPEPPFEVPFGQAEFFRSQQGLNRLSSGYGMTVLENPSAQSQVAQPTSSCVIAGGYPVLEDLTENPSFSFKTTAVYFADQVVSTAGWSALARMIAQSHCLIMGPGAEGELTVLRNSVASVQAISIAPSEWPSGPINPLLDSQAGSADSVSLPVGGRLVWNAAVRTAGTYRVWVRILRQPGAATVPVTVNGVAAGSVMPAISATVGYQWLSARSVHLNAGSARVILAGTSRGLNPEIAEIAIVRDDSTERVLPSVQPSWLVRDKDALDASLYRRLPVLRSHPVTTSPWHAVSGVRVADGPGAAATLTPTGTIRQLFSMVSATLRRAINATEPFAFRFQGAGRGAKFYLNFYFRNGSKDSVSFQDVTTKPRLLFFTPQDSSPGTRVPGWHPEWNQLTRVTLSTNSLYSPGGRIRIAGPFRVKSAHSLPYFAGNLPTTADPSIPGARLRTAMVSTAAPLQGLRPGILDFSQSFDPHWQLHAGARGAASIHTIELGFENSYLVEKGARHATLTYSLAAVGRASTIVSMVTWCISLVSLLAWSFGANIFRRQRGQRRARRRST